ncbi:hypothetical protein M513_06096 [Trichuris suis]|uniref:Uncharacterized protein n=1 Tax=Trichuris suis TaxID=68888 RepID=A0A085M6Y4_9BILA|nr:hypothetical protein M513_06096 [Trichuris suis]
MNSGDRHEDAKTPMLFGRHAEMPCSEGCRKPACDAFKGISSTGGQLALMRENLNSKTGKRDYSQQITSSRKVVKKRKCQVNDITEMTAP